jgi:hypothetical protein
MKVEKEAGKEVARTEEPKVKKQLNLETGDIVERVAGSLLHPLSICLQGRKRGQRSWRRMGRRSVRANLWWAPRRSPTGNNELPELELSWFGQRCDGERAS